MEKSPTEFDGSRELQCVGRMEIVRPKPVGFLCGSIPVPTDNSFHAFNSALLPSRQKVSAPRYRMLPTETDLNRPPLVANFPEKVLPLGAVQSKTTGDIIWEGGEIESKLSEKCEALAVSGLVEYGDEIDVIAGADILKQIFKIPYCKTRLSVAVRRVGRTLVLNTGPDIEEGENFIRRHSSQTKCADQSLFLNFAMHSVRMEACDCPPTHQPQTEGNPSSSVLRGAETSCYVEPNEDTAQEEGVESCSQYSEVKHDGFLWGSKKNKRSKSHDPIKKATHVSEKPRCSVQESEKYRRVGNNGFLRVLFWQFHNFRMLLGSDLLLFSNEKYAAVSLHLWDVTRQVTPLNWLEAWLDNVMASVPELAICYHQNGVVQGYELLKTDEIFLLKGISEDGTPAFHPHVVQQNGLTVLRFLQDNCKQDPGAYWLYKSAGEDVIQLFDLSAIPKNHSAADVDDASSALPSLVHRGRSNSFFSLGILLYRIAHRLSLSMTSQNKARCVRFLKKCLDFLDEPDHLVVRALAHEQFARLILNYEEELDVMMESFPGEYKVTVTDAEEEFVEAFTSVSKPQAHEGSVLVWEEEQSTDRISCLDISYEESEKATLRDLSVPRKLIASTELDLRDEKMVPLSPFGDENLSICEFSETSNKVLQTANDQISSKLAAVHHVSQAIKSLRWMRQLQSSEPAIVEQENDIPGDYLPTSMSFTVCTCGDADCIEVCDIREWLPTSKLDHKLWKLVLLLGESYLALGQAYKENGELYQALKIVELACSVYGSMPKQLDDTRFISSIVKSPFSKKIFTRNEKTGSLMSDSEHASGKSDGNTFTFGQFSAMYLFWAKAWMLVGDVYVEFHLIRGKDMSSQADQDPSSEKLQMSFEVVKEVQRLKKKLGQFNQNCSSCSLVNCSCQSDRASSGSSASSSSGGRHTLSYSRKQSKKSHTKRTSNSLLGDHQESVFEKEEPRRITDFEQYKSSNDCEKVSSTFNTAGLSSLSVNDSRDVVASSDVQNEEFAAAKLTGKKATEKNGGIFKYLRGGPLVGDTGDNLSVALNCYEEARKALVDFPSCSAELLSIMKREGWVWNELGRKKLERKELNEAELAFGEAINAFREVSDHTNIILINCNLGHGRRALAEENVTKIESLKSHPIFQNAYKQTLENVKFEYGESLSYYGAAIAELDAAARGSSSLPSNLKNEVYTQFAHTYLRFGMFLGRENATAEVFENKFLAANYNARNRRARKEVRKLEISANDAIRKALAVYESLGELRKQETAYAYFQLASYQRDCCLRLLETDENTSKLTKCDQRGKQYASLADRNWQRAIDFYRPQTHPTMYLTILLERSALLLSLSNSLHANMMLESALSFLLEGREVPDFFSKSLRKDYPELHGKFWSQLQMVLKKMLSVALASNSSRSTAAQSAVPSTRSADISRLKELYKMALKSDDSSQLHALDTLWTS